MTITEKTPTAYIVTNVKTNRRKGYILTTMGLELKPINMVLKLISEKKLSVVKTEDVKNFKHEYYK